MAQTMVELRLMRCRLKRRQVWQEFTGEFGLRNSLLRGLWYLGIKHDGPRIAANQLLLVRRLKVLVGQGLIQYICRELNTIGSAL